MVNIIQKKKTRQPRRLKTGQYLFCALCIFMICGCNRFEPYNVVLESGIPDKKYMIFDKSDQRLYLVEQDSIVSHYPAVYGVRRGRKQKQGDKKTPEGQYWVCTFNPKSKSHYFMGLSYPNLDDAKNGLASGLISKAEYRQIERALITGARPPWNTALGGAVGIHGTRYGQTVCSWFLPRPLYNWTAGCIAISNGDIDDLRKHIAYRTKIVIRK